MEELLRWLDIIPGRNWLLLGPRSDELAGLVRASYKPAGVTIAEDTAACADSTFDVAIGSSETIAPAELRRVLVPAGTAAVYAGSVAKTLAASFGEADLHAIQTRGFGHLTAVRGTR